MNDFRTALRALVKSHPEIDLVIVHQVNGDNDFFSHKPEVEACERDRVIAACQQIIEGIKETENRRGPGRQSCPDSKPGHQSPRCPAESTP